MSRNSLIAGQAGFSFGGFLFGQTARYAFNLLVARMLGAEFLGTYALAVAIIQIAEVFAVAGLDSALLRFINVQGTEPLRRREVIGSALKTSLLFSLVVLLLLMLFSGAIAALLNGSSLLQLALCCYAAALPFNAAVSLSGHAIQGFRNLQPKITAMHVMSPLLLLLLTLLFRFAFGPVAALCFPFALSAAGTFLWLRPRLSGITGTVARDILSSRIDRAMLSYALPFMGVSLLGMTAHWLDIVMLGMFTDTATVGMYHPAARTAGIIRSVFIAFSGIAAPMIAELHAGRETREIERIYRMVTRWIVSLVIPGTIVFMMMPVTVLGIFGPRFVPAGEALLLLSASSFLQAIFGLAATVLAMSGHARLSLLNAFSALVLQIVLNLLLIPVMGVNGAALSNLVVFLLLSLVRVAEVRVLLHIHPFGKALWKPLAAGVCSAAILLAALPFLDGLPLLWALVSGVFMTLAIYLSLMLLLKLEEEEKEIIFKALPFLNKQSGR
ncbi:MAG: polysaccharide biosynthesis protein [Chlorobiaceae bacterium]|nr:polysaccharide biosynthesis protein [Chlorobiaceae bacterium]NTV61225.1 polysaccharide biosynthesis protein [Chlorobiaceae bacterium]